MCLFFRAFLGRGVPRLSALLLVSPSFLSRLVMLPLQGGPSVIKFVVGRLLRISTVRTAVYQFLQGSSCSKIVSRISFLEALRSTGPSIGMANVQLWLHKLFDLYPTGSTAGHLTSRVARGIRIAVRHPKHCKWRTEILNLAGQKTAVSKRLLLLFPEELLHPPPWGPGGLSRECAPPYPQRDRKRRINGAVCRNHRIKRLVPCRC